MDVGFKRIKWFRTRTAYGDMQAFRARRAEMIQKQQALMDGVNNAMQNAQQNKISGATLLAAQAGIKRVHEMAKAKQAQMIKQIDSAQRVVDSAEAVKGSSSNGSSTVLDTVA